MIEARRISWMVLLAVAVSAVGILAGTTLPASAYAAAGEGANLAAGVPDNAPEKQGVIKRKAPVAHATIDRQLAGNAGNAGNATRLDGYAQKQLDAALLEGDESSASDSVQPASSLKANSLPASNRLSKPAKRLVKALKPQIAKVAAGKRTSTVFKVKPSALGIKTTWTASELGVSSILEYGDISDAAIDAAMEKIPDLDPVLAALIVDCPYELYWYDMEGDSDIDAGYCYADYIGGQWVLLFEDPITVTMSVAKGYRASANSVFKTSTKHASRIKKAVANAKGIVEDAAFKGTYDQLRYFRDRICALTEYDDEAAENLRTPYGDPWQLISVFDGDPKTKVVCEGYSKAFQYLCDLAKLPDTNCYTVTGYMEGYMEFGWESGAHMWNLVHMNDGRNYLVDLTNIDEGSHALNGLFIQHCKSGSVAAGYRFDKSSDLYVYDADAKTVFDTSALTVSSSAYVPPSKANPMTVKAETKMVSYSKLKKKSQKVMPISVKKAQGKVKYAKISGASCLKVNQSTGAVTVKKGTEKKTYTMRVKVFATGDKDYKAKAVTKTVKVTVR